MSVCGESHIVLSTALATNEANAARKVQEYSTKIVNMQASLREVEAKLEQANNNCDASHVSLANALAEKEKLLKENQELNAVCEELMAIVEGNEKS